MNDRGETPQRGTTVAPARRWLPLALVAVGLFWLTACGDMTGPGTGTGTVTSVTIDQNAFNLQVGRTAPLSATVVVEGNAAKDVEWRSSDTEVATVSRQGVVTAVAVGSATITATSTVDDTKSDTVTVTVIPEGTDVTPPAVTFTATPSQVDAGADVVLSWEVTGDYDTIRITRAGALVADALPASGDRTVNPTSSGTYTLEVTYDDGRLVTETARVSINASADAPVIDSFTAKVVRGSQIQFEWTASRGTSWELYAIGEGATPELLDSGSDNGSTSTVPIPASSYQHYRLDVINALGTTEEDIPGPSTVVTSTDDYDRYDGAGGTQQQAIPGTLRAIVQSAPEGSIIGFASDITSLDLKGVDLYRGISPLADAHLVIDKNLVISGPSGGRVTLQGVSAQPPGDTSVPLTWHSRMVYVAPGVTAELENLELTGGDFIYYGGGIGNYGTLTITNLLVTNNRALGSGGGIFNGPTGVLTIIDSVISDNGAFTRDDEVDVEWDIRGNPATGRFEGIGGYGGGIANREGGMVTIRNSQITDNNARFSGGGIYNVSSLTISDDTQISGNVADMTAYEYNPSQVSYGGGIMNGESATLDMTGGSIDGNTAAEQGGGLWLGSSGTARLTNVNIGGNTAGLSGITGYGGGIMWNFYTGENNLTLAGQTFNPVNVAAGSPDPNLESQDRGPRPANLNPEAIDPVQYRLSPLPPR